MNHDAYLIGSTSLQHLCYKMCLSKVCVRQKAPLLSVAGLSVQTALFIRATGQAAAISDTASKDNEGQNTPVFLLQPHVNDSSIKHSCHNIILEIIPRVSVFFCCPFF